MSKHKTPDKPQNITPIRPDVNVLQDSSPPQGSTPVDIDTLVRMIGEREVMLALLRQQVVDLQQRVVRLLGLLEAHKVKPGTDEEA